MECSTSNNRVDELTKCVIVLFGFGDDAVDQFFVAKTNLSSQRILK